MSDNYWEEDERFEVEAADGLRFTLVVSRLIMNWTDNQGRHKHPSHAQKIEVLSGGQAEAIVDEEGKFWITIGGGRFLATRV